MTKLIKELNEFTWLGREEFFAKNLRSIEWRREDKMGLANYSFPHISEYPGNKKPVFQVWSGCSQYIGTYLEFEQAAKAIETFQAYLND